MPVTVRRPLFGRSGVRLERLSRPVRTAPRRRAGQDYPGRVLPLLKYSVMRLAMFVAAMALLYLVGIKALLPNLLLAGVISLLLSYLLLRRPREELSQQIATRVSGRLQDPQRRSAVAEDAEIEDAAVDAALDEHRSQD